MDSISVALLSTFESQDSLSSGQWRGYIIRLGSSDTRNVDLGSRKWVVVAVYYPLTDRFGGKQ